MRPPSELEESLNADESNGTVTWRELLNEARRRLAESGVTDTDMDARRIVEHASGFEGAEFVLGLDRHCTVRGVAAFDSMMKRRIAGEPLQYVLGSWGFRTLDLLVDNRVLIPRPETEQVVGWALKEIDRIAEVVRERAIVVADLGTGSGAIGLSIVAERERTEVWATDISAAALDVTRANLAGLGRPAARVRLGEGSWFTALPSQLCGTLDVIISNPPYVAESEVLPDEVARWEPPVALVSGVTGIEALSIVIGDAPRWLSRPGALVVELAPNQAGELSAVATAAGFDEVVIADDFAGRQRALIARIH